jgi:hypothetical protein
MGKHAPPFQGSSKTHLPSFFALGERGKTNSPDIRSFAKGAICFVCLTFMLVNVVILAYGIALMSQMAAALISHVLSIPPII